MGIDVAI